MDNILFIHKISEVPSSSQDAKLLNMGASDMWGHFYICWQETETKKRRHDRFNVGGLKSLNEDVITLLPTGRER